MEVWNTNVFGRKGALKCCVWIWSCVEFREKIKTREKRSCLFVKFIGFLCHILFHIEIDLKWLIDSLWSTKGLANKLLLRYQICHFAYEFEKHDVATYQHSEIHESTFQTIETNIGKGNNAKVMVTLWKLLTFYYNYYKKIWTLQKRLQAKSCQEK